MNENYMEEMDILINDFNTELDNILHGRTVRELGIEDLQKLKREYESLEELNQELIDKARKDTTFSNEDLKNLMDDSTLLKMENASSIDEINSMLSAKIVYQTKLKEELEKVKQQKEDNLRTLREFRTFALISKAHGVPEIVTQFLDTKIKEFEDKDKKFEEQIGIIEEELRVIERGGMLPLYDRLIAALKGMSPERVAGFVREEAKAREEGTPTKEGPSFDERAAEDTRKAHAMIDEIKEDGFTASGPTMAGPSGPSTSSADEPSTEETMEEAPTIEEPKPDETLSYLQEKGELPKLSEDRLLEICGLLGINVGDIGLDFIPNEEQLSRLKNDKVIKNALANEEIQRRHSEFRDVYGSIQSEYERINESDHVKGMAEDKDVKIRLASEEAQIDEKLANYDANIESIDLENLDSNFDLGKKSKLVGNLDKGSSKINEQIRKGYGAIDELREKKIKQQTVFGQSLTEFRIKGMLFIVDNLGKLQGMMDSKQYKIMSKQTDKYIKKKNKDFEKMQKRMEAEKKVLRYENDLELSNGKGLFDKLERARLTASIKIVERLNGLSKKTGERRGSRHARYSIEDLVRTEEGPSLVA